MTDERDRTPLPMLVVPSVLLACALAVALVPGAVPAIEQAAARFSDHGAYAAWVLHGASIHLPHLPPSHISGEDVLFGAISVLGAVTAAGLGLFGRPLRESLARRLGTPATRPVAVLRGLHSGHIGDYIAWWTAGASLFGGVCLLALT